jgi:UDP-GlcNAc:undecaprenyl-phosphate/decaprenyl-phosphate GlcNAc-1-phosphate transferase
MEIIILLASITFTFFGLIIYQNIYLKNKIIDKVIDRSSHNVNATRSGGIALYTSIFIISCILYILGIEKFDYAILIPLSILIFIGIYDDLQNVDFKLKFIFQIIAAKIMIDNGMIIDNLHGILGIFELNRIVSQLLTIFIVVAIINAINFIDGIDGLAILIVTLFIIFYELLAVKETSFHYLSIIILIAFIPMLYYNFRKKDKVFLGDSGSLFLGGLVSIYTLDILSPSYLIMSYFDINKVLFMISILIYPIIDIVRVVFLRIMKNQSPFIADKNHLHHLLLNKLNRHDLVVTSILIFSIIVFLIVHLIF